MDPLTQGLLGAAIPQAAEKNRNLIFIAGALGFLGGMAADLDTFIRSSTDPLIYLKYHRHFTHSLAFIPVGGLLCAAVLHWFVRRRWALSFLQTFFYCTLGYATHALLDAMTSYGTLLLWPFSEARIDWSVVAVIDPLFTVPLGILVILATVKRKPIYARAGLAWGAFYLFLGLLQHLAALDMTRALAASRGHVPSRVEVKPSFANLLVWKTIYETEGHFHVDAVRAGLSPRVFDGVAVPKLDMARDLPWLQPTSQQALDLERFRWFSQGFIAPHPDYPDRIIDIRYSFVPNAIEPLWWIELTPGAEPTAHVKYIGERANARDRLSQLWAMLLP